MLRRRLQLCKCYGSWRTRQDSQNDANRHIRASSYSNTSRQIPSLFLQSNIVLPLTEHRRRNTLVSSQTIYRSPFSMTSSAPWIPFLALVKHASKLARWSVICCCCSSMSTSQRCRRVSRAMSKSYTLDRSLLAIFANNPRLSRWRSCSRRGRGSLRRFWEDPVPGSRLEISARAGREVGRRVGTDSVVGSSS